MLRRHANTGDNADAESNPSSRRDADSYRNCGPGDANRDFHSNSHSNSDPNPSHSASNADEDCAYSDAGYT